VNHGARPRFLQQHALHIVVAAAIVVNLNTLPASFTFDDNFAVVGGATPAHIGCWLHCLHASDVFVQLQINNGDVTNNNITLRDLFKHDFWWVPCVLCEPLRDV